MARKKSAEELALEAELASADKASDKKVKQPAITEASLDDVSGKSKKAKKPRKKPGFLKHFGFLKTTKGKIITAVVIVVVAALVFGVVSIVRSNHTDKWDGTQDTSWYKKNKTSFTLWTCEEFAGLGKLIDEREVMFDGVTIKIGCNLDMCDIKMKPFASGRTIDGVNYEFRGNLDGRGHTISGLNIEEDTWDNAGIFGTASGGYIKDLTIEGKVVGMINVGGFAGRCENVNMSNLTNRCDVSAMKTATSYYPVTAEAGGIAGEWMDITFSEEEGSVDYTLENLVNEGEISARACSAGGVFGLVISDDDNTLTVKNITNKGSVTLFCDSDERTDAAGGVIGEVSSFGCDVLFDGLTNEGEVICSSVKCVGGVFGAFSMPANVCVVKNCKNTARLVANDSSEVAHVGGIFGYLEDPAKEYKNCTNTGELAATNGNSHDIYWKKGRSAWDLWDDEHPERYY